VHTTVVVGHSYGGAVISNVAADAGDITTLVYVAAFAPRAGGELHRPVTALPGSTLGDALQPVPRQDGTVDLLIARDRFHEQFCADVPAPEAGLMPRLLDRVGRVPSGGRAASAAR
jgi:pimeloyl-ACP methyl ester carboxylesterase